MPTESCLECQACVLYFFIVLFTFYFTQHWISSHFSVFMEYTFCLLETVLTKQTNRWGTRCDKKIVLSLLWIRPCTIFLEAAFYADLLPFSWRTLKPDLRVAAPQWMIMPGTAADSISLLSNFFFENASKKSSTDDKTSPFLPLKKALSMEKQPNSVLIDICFLTSNGITWDVNLYVAGNLAACFSARREHY